MTRHYLRLDPGFYERKLLGQGYPPGAVTALIGCLCLAEQQPQRGRFRDRKVLGVLLGSARWIPFLVERGDLVERDELPRLYVDGWDEWQEGDWKVAERVGRLRSRTHRVTPDVTVPVTALRNSGGGGGAVSNSGGGKSFRHHGQHEGCAVCEPLRMAVGE